MCSRLISNGNSTSVPLTSSSSFTGTMEDVSQYTSILITINSDASSQENGVQLYSGATNSSLKLKVRHSYVKNENKTIPFKVTDRFFKIIYNNGTTAQTVFTIQTYYTVHNMDTDMNVSFNQNLLDLFGNLKTSTSFTLLDISHIFDKNYLMMDELVTGGTSTYNQAAIDMSVTTAGHSVIRQSRIYSPYQPGKALVIRLTGVLNSGSNASSVTSRLGYFDHANGLFFEYANQTMYVVERNNSVDTRVAQTNWNVDTLNGSGVSGVTVGFNYNIIYNIEFVYLGSGNAKLGVYYDGIFHVAHIFHHTDITYSYLATPNLPVRYEITSTGGAGSMICSCASIQSNGGYNLIGFSFSGGMTTTGKIVSTSDLNYMMSIRLATNQRKLVKLKTINIFCTTSSNAAYELFRCYSKTSSPITWTSYVAADVNSAIEYDITAPVNSFDPISTDSVLVHRGYFSNNVNTADVNLLDPSAPLYITSGINTPTYATDYYILCVRDYDGGSHTYYASLNWIEMRP